DPVGSPDAGGRPRSQKHSTFSELFSDGGVWFSPAMQRDFTWIVVAYAVGFVVAAISAAMLGWQHPIAVAFGADVAATVAVFAFSVAFNNSSFYDAYWSVAPIAIVFYWLHCAVPEANGLRELIATALVCAWGVRLTYNWARGWGGLGHEDWRYV